MDDELPYRTPLTSLAPRRDSSETSSDDERNYNSLLIARNDIREQMDSLMHDFNAFDILSPGLSAAKRDEMVRQAGGNQIAYAILSTTLESLDRAIRDVDNKYNPTR